MSICLEEVSCAVCSSKQYELYAQGHDYEYATSENLFQMVRCRDCGNIYLNPRPARQELGVIYPSNYYAYNYDEVVSTVARQAKDFLDKGKVRQWLGLLKKSPSKILDVGCGNGHFLELLHKIGIDKANLYGVEMNCPQMHRMREEGYQTFDGRIEEVVGKLHNIKFDLIVLMQVLEHVEAPDVMVQLLANLLAPGGILILETPNSDSLDVHLFKTRYWGGYHFPRHFNIFSFQTLRRLIEKTDLQIVSHKYLPSQSFWILSLHHLISAGWSKPSLARWFDPLQNIPLLSIFTLFDIIRSKLGFKTSNIQIVAAKKA